MNHIFQIFNINFEILHEYHYNHYHHLGKHDLLSIDNKIVYDILYDDNDDCSRFIEMINSDCENIIYDYFIKLNNRIGDFKYNEFKKLLNDLIF